MDLLKRLFGNNNPPQDNIRRDREIEHIRREVEQARRRVELLELEAGIIGRQQ